MSGNRLAGSGPNTLGPANSTGPIAAIQGSLGAQPQAASTPSMASNMLASGGGSGAPGAPPPPPPGMAGGNLLSGAGRPGMPGQRGTQPPLVPPSKEVMIDVLHRTSYINEMLRDLMMKPDLSTRDVINEVGVLIAEQIMDPFMAGKYLSTMPQDSAQLRQWVTQHYMNSQQTMRTVAEMLEAAGRQSRAQSRMPLSQMMGQPSSPVVQNALSGAGYGGQ